jgi:hypothetical protein
MTILLAELGKRLMCLSILCAATIAVTGGSHRSRQVQQEVELLCTGSSPVLVVKR